jgi:hypothetical protein
MSTWSIGKKPCPETETLFQNRLEVGFNNVFPQKFQIIWCRYIACRPNRFSSAYTLPRRRGQEAIAGTEHFWSHPEILGENLLRVMSKVEKIAASLKNESE